MEATFYLSAAVAVAATLMVVTRASASCAALPDRVPARRCGRLFCAGGAVCRCTGGHHLRRRRHGAVRVRDHDANLGKAAAVKEREWLSPGMWVGPAILSALLLAELIYILVGNVQGAATISGGAAVESKEVGIALFGPYLLGVELASLLLLAGLVGACHLGWHTEHVGVHIRSPVRIGAAMRTASGYCGNSHASRPAARRNPLRAGNGRHPCPAQPDFYPDVDRDHAECRRACLRGGRFALGQADGQVMFIFILSVAAAEVSVGLALLLLLHRRFQTLDADA